MTAAAPGRGGADHPVELPAADGRLEDRAGAGLRQHGRAEARRDHAAHGAAAGRADRRRPSFRPAWSTSSPARGRRAPRWPPTRAWTRWRSRAPPSVGKAIRRAVAGTGTRLTLELGGKGAHIVFDDAALDQAVEGIVDGIFFNQGHVCCAGLAPAGAGGRRRGPARPAAAAHRAAAHGRSAGQEHRRRRDQLARRSSSASADSWRAPPPTGCRIDQPARPAARARLLLPAHHRQRRRRVGARSRARRSSARCSPCRPSAPRPRPSPRPTPRATGSRPASGPRRARASCGCRQRLRAGVVWANCFNQFDPASPFGGVRESGFGREGGRQGLAEYLSPGRRRRMSERARGPQDLQAVHRRRLPALGVGPHHARHRAGRPPAGPRGAGLAQGRARRGARRPGRPGRDGPAARPTTAAQILYRIAEVLEGRAAQLAGELEAVGVAPRTTRAPTWRRRSTRPSTGPASPTSSTSSWAR